MVDFHRNINNHGGHIPPQPLWVGIIRAVQGLFTILVLGLAANAASYVYLDGYGMAFFTFCWTTLFLLYVWITPHFLPQFYNDLAHLAFEATVTIFWLVTFALLANYVRIFSGSYWGYYNYYNNNGWTDSTRAAMAFALLNWLLFCFTLALSLLLWRRHNGHSIPINLPSSDNTQAQAHPPAAGAAATSTATTPASTSGGFKFSNLFSRNKAAPDAEKGVTNPTHSGPVHETGQPVEMQTATHPVQQQQHTAP